MRRPLHELIEGVPLASPLPTGWGALLIGGLNYDSRKVEAGDLFFAFPGSKADGRTFAAAALERGAVAVVSESPAPAGFPAPWIHAAHGRQALARIARRWFDSPDEHLSLTGITGTNGKTTISLLVDHILRRAGFRTGVVGTIGYHVLGEARESVNTTPESLDLLRLLAEVRAGGGSHVTMEVSSHALELGRVHGIRFSSVVFSNLTRDHLDFHGGMEEYFAAKRKLFHGAGGPPPQHAVINADDPWAQRLDPPPATRVIRYGIDRAADLRASRLELDFSGLRFDLEWGGGRWRVESPLSGRFNAANLLAAFGTALSYGLEPAAIASALRTAPPVPGRFEKVDEGQPFLVVVDYAHTDDALRNLIQAARALNPKRVVTLFGCGGDRDRTKRPLMAQAAAEMSDYVILTSDNPRSEDPLRIINDALVGLRRTDTPHRIEPDRARAIAAALKEAGPGDAVLIAGKGHETYQILGTGTIQFDDRETARGLLREFGYKRREDPA
ncbi:MAG: UDP-N-acetylmuramoyl-L-alanyl-D-glutamate--2,6-diaminopimelate ligase [Bryobacteraceae bacterium]|nr:UDP-N-acetylmuramoyl-L-alanyl-D-glutamate--2,6-diaminopimelate ligase [Bryobacteraceae bacterium]